DGGHRRPRWATPGAQRDAGRTGVTGGEMAAILESVASTEGLSEDLAELARKVRASVVAVRCTASGGGAGVVWDPRGIVVTNHHVATGQRAEVDLGDGERLPARVIGQSRQLDLAVLKIDQEIAPGRL